jgi:hypothetical protein
VTLPVITVLVRSWCSSVDTAGLRAGWLGIQAPLGAGNFSPHHRVQTGSGAHPASNPIGTRGSFPGGKAADAWSWPLTPSSAEVKNAWLYTSTPQHDFMAWCSVTKAEGQQQGRSVSTETRVRAGWRGFNSRQGQWWDFSLRHRTQTGPGTHLATYLMGIGSSYLVGKAAGGGGMKLTVHLHLEQRLRMCGVISSLRQIRLHGVMFSYAQGQLYLDPTLRYVNYRVKFCTVEQVR